LSLGGSTEKQVRKRIHKRNNTKNTVQTIQNTVNTIIHITRTNILVHYKTTHTHTHTLQPIYTHNHTLQNKLKQPQFKIYPNEIDIPK
jgi:hypothetical protein